MDLPDFTRLIELTGPKALGLFIACTLLYLGNAKGLIPLDQISPSAPAINEVVGILAGALALMWIIEAILAWVRDLLQKRQLRRVIRGRLSTLTPEEEDLLRAMLRKNQQSTSMHAIDPVANLLVQKGLLLRGGTGGVTDFPFAIPDVVWVEMKRLWR